METSETDVVRLLALMDSRRETLACAESFTGGLLAAQLIEPAGASSVFLGGIIAYSPQIKIRHLGVDPKLIAQHGTVHARVAAQMARGARSFFESDWALATTGVAGPEYHEGHRPGTLFVALAGRGVENDDPWVEGSVIAGSRTSVRNAGVSLALSLARRVITPAPAGTNDV